MRDARLAGSQASDGREYALGRRIRRHNLRQSPVAVASELAMRRVHGGRRVSVTRTFIPSGDRQY